MIAVSIHIICFTELGPHAAHDLLVRRTQNLPERELAELSNKVKVSIAKNNLHFFPVHRHISVCVCAYALHLELFLPIPISLSFCLCPIEKKINDYAVLKAAHPGSEIHSHH